MSGNSCASALQTAPIVIDFCARRALPAADGALGPLELGVQPLDVCGVWASVGVCGRHQRAWKVSLYLPICTSSPSSRRWDSIRERLT